MVTPKQNTYKNITPMCIIVKLLTIKSKILKAAVEEEGRYIEGNIRMISDYSSEIEVRRK